MTSNVDEPISITEYDPDWPRQYEAERQRVRDALGLVAVRVEHFGSSAVPGLASKPIIDLLVGVRDLQEAKRHLGPLVALGYEDFGEIFISGRIYLRKRGTPPHFNVAITELDSPFWTTSLTVRDYLRAHPHEAEAYARAKREAVGRGATLFSSYSREKDAFVASLRERALAWGRGARV